jgi:Tol biopolymer transport system component
MSDMTRWLELSWSSDGRLILFDYQQLVGDDDLDIWVLDMQTLEAKAYLSGKFSQGEGRLSPDGRWIAYTSNESGKSEIYVQGFPEADGRWMVSNDGGARGAYTPAWGDDGRGLWSRGHGQGTTHPLQRTSAGRFEQLGGPTDAELVDGARREHPMISFHGNPEELNPAPAG